MIKKVFLIISILLIIFLGRNFFQEYMMMHPYYMKIAGSRIHWKILGWGLASSLIPVLYLMYAKRKSFWWLITTLFLGLFIFGLNYINLKANIFGGGVKFFFNTLFLLGLGIYILVGFTALGSLIKEKILKLNTKKTRDILLDIGLGLIVFLLLVYILLFVNILYTGISWIVFFGLGVMIFLQRNILTQYRDLLSHSLDILSMRHIHISGKGFWSVERWVKIGAIFLFIISLRYFYNGFQLAYLPYPTAWDANHAYMFYPKMRALHHGLYWNEISMVTTPHIWYMFITYFFSLFIPHGFMGISADTIAIEMNFLSGILVLFFGLGLISVFLSFLKKITKIGNGTNTLFTGGVFLLGWFLLMGRLTSGMGAFLVFIDNKTDLGVLALIILALYSGFIFLSEMKFNDEIGNFIQKDEIGGNQNDNNILKYIELSGIFYAFAVLAKPTAMFDVLNFSLFLWSFWFGWIGIIGISLVVIGFLTLMKFRGIKDYLPQKTGIVSLTIGLLGLGFDTIKIFLKKSWRYIKYLLFWIGIFLLTVVIVKLSFILTYDIVYKSETNMKSVIEKVLFGKIEKKSKNNVPSKGLHISDITPLYAQVGNIIGGDVCTLHSQGFQSSADLYKNIKKVPGSAYNEDNGRYVGYGWKGNMDTDIRRGIKPFHNPRWLSFLKPGCYSFNPFLWGEAENAKILCQTEIKWKTLEIDKMKDVLNQLIPSQSGYTFLKTLINDIQFHGGSLNRNQLLMTFAPTIHTIDKYIQDNTIKKTSDGEVYFPYRYLNLFNNSFNRSLQNLSSYYTDIGVVRLMLFLFLFLGLIYGFFEKKRILIGMSLVTIFGRVMRWFIGGGILRYAIGIIIWTILSFVVYCYYLIISDKNDDIERTLGIIFVFVFIIFGGYQLGLNMLRISSQGGGGTFMWYKTNHGVKEIFDEKLQIDTSPKGGFGADDVFDMQFAHYKKFLNLKNTGRDDEGAVIAGTYTRYFVHNQHYVVYDQFLTWLREQFSDGNICNSYLRLKDKHVKYVVIDPNIGTVVQGAGNQSLFDRFFARVDTTTDALIEDGVITTLAKMYASGYLKYISSNNLGAKYAFIMPDKTFNGLTGDNLALMRARMSVARFFGGRSIDNPLVKSIVELAEQRVRDGHFIGDIADMMGLQIDEGKLIKLLLKGTLNPLDIKGLSQDERKSLVQYLNIRGLLARSPEQARQQLQSIVINSINSGNQIIVLEVE